MVLFDERAKPCPRQLSSIMFHVLYAYSVTYEAFIVYTFFLRKPIYLVLNNIGIIDCFLRNTEILRHNTLNPSPTSYPNRKYIIIKYRKILA